MKKIYCHVFLLLLLNIPGYSQAVLQIGEPFIPDAGYDLLLTQDGGFVTCGHRGNTAAVFRSDCAGNLVAQIEKQYAPGPGRFFDAVQLPDGSIVAVGSCIIATPSDTLERVVILKTNSALAEIAVANFPVLNKSARGKSVAIAPNGAVLVFGEVTGLGVDFNDMFLQRVNTNSLQPVGDPLIYNNGVDIAEEIIGTVDGNYLLTGSSFLGNIFDPNAVILNRLLAIKTTENGAVLWHYAFQDNFQTQYGLAHCGGVEQNPVTGNFLLSGTTYGGSPQMHQDAFFLLLDNNGNFLDSAFLQAPMRQGIYGMTTYTDVPGLYLAVGDSDNPVFGTPNLLAAQAIEVNGQIFQSTLINETASPYALTDVIEMGQNRLAILATLPDNPALLDSKDIIVATPEIGNIEILYQNCALVASFSATDPMYQWYLDDTPLPGATGGVYFPAQSGVYRVRITDNLGCSGYSDTLAVTLTAAGFDIAAENLTATFTNTSTSATTWFWDFGDGQTSTLENPEHDYASEGVYTVTLIASSQCGSDTISQIIGLTGSAEPSWLHQFLLFPNPGEGVFSVEIKGRPQAELGFSFYSTTGQLIDHQSFGFHNGNFKHTFDFGVLPPGVYNLKIQADSEAKYVRVVVTR